MAVVKFMCLIAIAFFLAFAHAEVRVARSPQFGGGAYSQASAQARGGGFGGPYPGIFGPRPQGFGGPYPGVFGPRSQGFGGHGFGGYGYGRPGPSISISKSISIGGGGGSAQSSAGSNSYGK